MIGQRPARKDVMTALFNALQAAPSLQAQGIQTWGRRLIHWGEVAAQPALFLRTGNDENSWQGSNRVLTMGVEVWLYTMASQDPTVPPDDSLNVLLDALDAALAPDDAQGELYTIGGFVFWCRLNGRIEKYAGDLGAQAIAVADLEITVP